MPHGNRRNQGRDLTAFRPYRLLDFLEQMHVAQSWLSTDDLPHERAKDQDVKQADRQGTPFGRMVGGKLLHDFGFCSLPAGSRHPARLPHRDPLPPSENASSTSLAASPRKWAENWKSDDE